MEWFSIIILRSLLTVCILLKRNGSFIDGSEPGNTEVCKFAGPSAVHHTVRALQVAVVVDGALVDVLEALGQPQGGAGVGIKVKVERYNIVIVFLHAKT